RGRSRTCECRLWREDAAVVELIRGAHEGRHGNGSDGARETVDGEDAQKRVDTLWRSEALLRHVDEEDATGRVALDQGAAVQKRTLSRGPGGARVAQREGPIGAEEREIAWRAGVGRHGRDGAAIDAGLLQSQREQRGV